MRMFRVVILVDAGVGEVRYYEADTVTALRLFLQRSGFEVLKWSEI